MHTLYTMIYKILKKEMKMLQSICYENKKIKKPFYGNKENHKKNIN